MLGAWEECISGNENKVYREVGVLCSMFGEQPGQRWHQRGLFFGQSFERIVCSCHGAFLGLK